MNIKNQALKDLWIQIAKEDQTYYESAQKPDGVSVSRNFYYAQSTNNLQALEIIRPKDAKEILPVIVHIHGGAWVYGHKDTYYKYYCMALAKQGYAVLNVNYRLAFEDPFPACIQDLFKVFEWMVANAKKQRLDLKNVFFVGDSAGAHLAALSAEIHHSYDLQIRYKVKASDFSLKAVGLSCGVYDFERFLRDNPEPLNLVLLKTIFHRTDFRRHPLYMYSSASYNLSSSFPPAYVLSSYSDVDLVQETETFIDELKALRLTFKERIMPKKLKLFHVFNIKLNTPESTEAMDEMCAFFQSFTS